MNMHDERINIECLRDVIGFWMQECIALSKVKPEGCIFTSKVCLPQQLVKLLRVCEVGLSMQSECV